ncbi:hypothetical protein KUTeg_020652 [Tegillarca granosa]|uniref:Ubiquitin-like protease family profile domain-containing protein n=1 Tax=Tegillarca granosa TaxID=220873 RepID=A0ABQ9EE01_TEGGR|nr:hypothetical protein KUTeg_020652 [Tegillarca granosa]
MAEEDDDVVLSFYDSLLRKSDVKLLEDSHWLNDNLIAFCFEYFEREQFNHSADKIALISPDVTQYIKLAPAPFGKMKFIEDTENPQQNNGYDCGIYVIATAEHMCRELCEGYCIPLKDTVTPSVVKEKRQQLIDLIHKVAKEFGS